MAETATRGCRVEYRGKEIVVQGPSTEVHREAHRIVRRFACSATPYRIDEDDSNRVVLKPE